MRRSSVVALVGLSSALFAAAACTSLKDEAPTPSIPDAATDTSSPPPADGSEPTGDGGADATNDGPSVDAGPCATDCRQKYVSTCNGTTSETTGGLGRCVGGTCVYPKVVRPCTGACNEGYCTEPVWAEVLATGGPFFSVWGPSADDVWAGGQSLVHYDGTRWSTVPTGSLLDGKNVFGISGAAADDFAMMVANKNGGSLVVYRYHKGTFDLVAQLPACSLPFGSIFAHTTDEYFVHCADDGLYRVRLSPPAVATIVANPGSFPPGQTLHNALDGFVFDDGELTLMAAGQSVSYFYTNLDGGRVQNGGGNAFSVLNRRDVFGFLELGQDAVLYPTDGGSPARTALNGAIGETQGYFRSMVGTSGRRVFVGGSRAVVAHYDGTRWHKDTVPQASASTPFTAMWASPWGDVFALGQQIWQAR